eukprot:TRINITY_DN5047_c0_g2_i1.p1 TRINITY_DN5047_c0_g2~~TRINITY_DN5047_c0_g2_i1.p1  ORF type:complete len:1804 (-),score=402.05 TRINITY_DN5047_c0_g2_i1:105-5516(-)
MKQYFFFLICILGIAGIAATSWINGAVSHSEIDNTLQFGVLSLSQDDNRSVVVRPRKAGVGGGSSITIRGVELGSGSDISAASVCGRTLTIVAQNVGSVTGILPPGALASIACNVTVESTSRGVTTAVGMFTYNPQGAILSVTPLAGPESGGNTVTITGRDFTSGTDLTAAVLSYTTGTNVTVPIMSYNQTVVYLRMPVCTAGSRANVALFSRSYDPVTSATQYVCNPTGAIAHVTPNIGPRDGVQITVQASAPFGDGTDITSVTLCGNTTAIVSQTAINVVVNFTRNVLSGALNEPSYCDVVVSSVRYGQTSRSNVFQLRTSPYSFNIRPVADTPAGGTLITIKWGIETDVDIAQVRVGSNSATIVQGFASDTLIFAAPPGILGSVVPIVAYSPNYGKIELSDMFTYAHMNQLVAVVPASAPLTGALFASRVYGNFGSATVHTVRYGATVATVLRTSPIYATPPAAALQTSGSVVSVTVTTSQGAAVLPNCFTYYVPPPAPGPSQLPVIPLSSFVTLIQPSVLSPVGGQSVTLYGGVLTDCTAVHLCNVTASIVSKTADTLTVSSDASVPCTGSVTLFGAGGNALTMSETVAVSYKPQVVISPSSALVPEGGGAVVFAAVLSSAPDTLVEIPLTTMGAAQISPSVLLFDEVNWNVPQTFHVQKPRDYRYTANPSCRVKLGSAFCPEDATSLFAGISLEPDLQCSELDTVGLQITSPTIVADNILVNNAFAPKFLLFHPRTDVLTLQLATMPDTNVTVRFTPLTNSDRIHLILPGGLDSMTLQWGIPQNITISTVASSGLLSGLAQVNLVVTCASSSATDGYSSLNTTITLLIGSDAISEALQVQSSTPYEITESGGTAQVFGVLATHLNNDVMTVTASPAAAYADVFRVQPATRTLTESDVRQPLSWLIVPIDDWVMAGDVHALMTLTYSLSGIVSTTTVTIIRRDNDTAGIVTSAEQLVVNETGSSSALWIRLTSQPAYPITISAYNNNSAEVAISWTSFTVMPSGWRAAIPFVATGLRDYVRDNGLADVRFNVTSQDPNYHGRNFTVRVWNLDIYFPRVLDVRPLLFPYNGFEANISCVDCLPGVQAWVHGKPVSRLRYNALTHTLTCRTPEHNITGYLNLTLRNTDGGSSAYAGLFYSNDCPFEGFFGYGDSCTTCPPGGVCPGGPRLWAANGFWINAEFDMYVQQCPYPDRCPGGTSANCTTGYAGALCTACADNYYAVGDECSECNDPTQQALLLMAQFVFVLIVFVVIFTASDGIRDNIMFLMGCFRVLWVVSVDEASGLPLFVVELYAKLSLFAGDLNFVRPGCSGINTFSQLYAVNVGVMLGLLVPMALMQFLRYLYWKRTIVDGMKRTESERNEAHIGVFKANLARTMLSFTTLLFFVYQILIVKSLQAVNCLAAERTLTGGVTEKIYVLVADTRQTCFEGAHWPVFLAAIIILPLIGVVLPAVVLGLAKRAINKEYLGIVGQQVGSKAISELIPQFWWYETGSYLTVELVLAILSVFASGLAQIAATTVVLLLVLLFMIYFNPYREWFKNVGLVITLLVAFLTQMASLMVFMEQYIAAMLVAYSLVVLLGIFVAGTVIVILYYFIQQRRLRRIEDVRHRQLLRDGLKVDTLTDDQVHGKFVELRDLAHRSASDDNLVMNRHDTVPLRELGRSDEEAAAAREAAELMLAEEMAARAAEEEASQHELLAKQQQSKPFQQTSSTDATAATSVPTTSSQPTTESQPTTNSHSPPRTATASTESGTASQDSRPQVLWFDLGRNTASTTTTMSRFDLDTATSVIIPDDLSQGEGPADS